MIDDYCERTDPSFWAEPLNAISNLSFFLAALYGFLLWRRSGFSDRWIALLALVAASVGTGSFLFHTLATPTAMLADVIPIAVYIAIGFALVLHRLVGLTAWGAILATAAFMLLSPMAARIVAPVFGSSAGYVPVLVALLLIGGGLTLRRVPGGGAILAAGLVFTVSIGLRMGDLPLCDAWPHGTHVGWHLLNGLVLALVMRALNRPSPLSAIKGST